MEMCLGPARLEERSPPESEQEPPLERERELQPAPVPRAGPVLDVREEELLPQKPQQHPNERGISDCYNWACRSPRFLVAYTSARTVRQALLGEWLGLPGVWPGDLSAV